MAFQEGEGLQHAPGKGGEKLLCPLLAQGEVQPQVKGVHGLGREEQFPGGGEACMADPQPLLVAVAEIFDEPAENGVQGGLVVVAPFLGQALSQQDGYLAPQELGEFLLIAGQVLTGGGQELRGA